MWTQDLKKPLLKSDKASAPEQSRSCNDILFALLFIACCAGMAVVSSIAFSKGDPRLLVSSNTDKQLYNYTSGQLQNAVAQLKTDTDIIMGSVALAVVVGLAWVQLLKLFTKLFIYLSILLGIAMVSVLGGYFVHMGRQRADDGISIVGYCLFGVAFLMICISIFMKKKLELTAAMIKEACRGVQNNCLLAPMSLIVVAVFLAFSSYWVASFIYLYSIPGDSVAWTPSDKFAPKFNESIRNLMWFMLFGFFWISAFISAVFQHVVAGSVSSWYFSRDLSAPRPSRAPAISSLFRAITTSFGSLAFGALLIAIVEFVHALLYWAKKTNYNNKLVVFVIKCIQCLLSCVECALKFVNKYAIVYVAMHGHSFCHSAREAMSLIGRNFFGAVITDVVSGFVLNLGKIAFTALSTLVTIVVVDHLGRPLSGVTLGVTSVLSFVILHILSLIISTGVDTVFVCVLEDVERNPDGNLYLSPDLHDLLKEKSATLRSTSSV